MNRSFEFNTIYVVESLADHEEQTGEILYNDIIKRSSDRTGMHHTKLIKVDTKEAFCNALTNIKNHTHIGYYPFIHFEIHGSNKKNGLILKSGEIILWKELFSLTQQINIITKNNLVISLATCYGAYFLSEIKIYEAAPFCGFVSTTGLLYEDEIIAGFTSFFESIFDNRDFDIAVEKLNTANGLQKKYKFQTAEEFFEDLISNMMPNFGVNHIDYKMRVIQLVNQSKLSPTYHNKSEDELRENIVTLINKQRETFKAEYKKTFLLSD